MTGERRSATAITLRALRGEPLSDPAVRDMVVAAAHALAERTGITILDLRAEPDRVTITLEALRVVALGFAAELRRSTTAWYTRKYDVGTLWGEPDRE